MGYGGSSCTRKGRCDGELFCPSHQAAPQRSYVTFQGVSVSLVLAFTLCTLSGCGGAQSTARYPGDREWAASAEERILLEQCEGGDADLCLLLVALRAGVARTREGVREAGWFAERACAIGDVRGCELQRRLRSLAGVETLDGYRWAVMAASCEARPAGPCGTVVHVMRLARLSWFQEPERLLPRLSSACRQGESSACLGAGDLAFARNGFTSAASYYRSGCEAGSPEACFELGWGLATERGLSAERVEVADVFRVACGLGHARSCDLVAKVVAQAWGVSFHNHAVRLALEAGYLFGAPVESVDILGAYDVQVSGGPGQWTPPPGAAACLADDCVGDVLLLAALRRIDDATRDTALSEACHAGAPLACGVYGVAAPTAQDAESSLQVACANGWFFACDRLQEPVPDATVLESCDAGQELACFEAARRGLRVFDPHPLPMRACSEMGPCADAVRACEEGSGMACRRAALMLVEGDRVFVDHRRATELMERGCALGDPDACFRSETTFAGDQTSVSPDRRASLVGACNEGHAPACFAASDDQADGVNLVRRACDLGYVYACGHMRSEGPVAE